MADSATATELKNVWDKVLKEMKVFLNEETFNNSIMPIVPLSYSDGIVKLGVGNDFFISWLKEQFGSMIESALSTFFKRSITIEFEAGHKPVLVENATNPKTKEKSVATKIVKKVSTYNCHSRHTFENYVIGPENEFAAAAALGITKKSALSATNPLFIYGGTGLGKTHLLQAIAHKVADKNNDAIIEYISCEEFLNLYIDSVKNNKHSKFRNRFRRADYLMIDDIHFLAGKPAIQEEFFNTFNKLHNEDKKIVLTSDRRPSEISRLEERLVSRFDSGLTVDIQPLGVETRLAVLRKKQEEHLIKIDDSVLAFIANKITSNVRRLEGALTRVLAFLSLKGGNISVIDAERVLQPMLEEEVVASVTIDTIQKRVASHFDLKVIDLTGTKRPRNIAEPRMMAMYLCRKMTNKSLPEIGGSFSRNHATVMHAVKEISKRQENDDALKHHLTSLERQLQNG